MPRIQFFFTASQPARSTSISPAMSMDRREPLISIPLPLLPDYGNELLHLSSIHPHHSPITPHCPCHTAALAEYNPFESLPRGLGFVSFFLYRVLPFLGCQRQVWLVCSCNSSQSDLGYLTAELNSMHFHNINGHCYSPVS